jgi:hypothetical protein
MRCSACNAVIEKEIWDSERKEYSPLCRECWFVSELDMHNAFVEQREYVHGSPAPVNLKGED